MKTTKRLTVQTVFVVLLLHYLLFLLCFGSCKSCIAIDMQLISSPLCNSINEVELSDYSGPTVVFRFDNVFKETFRPNEFYSVTLPTPLSNPYLTSFNYPLFQNLTILNKSVNPINFVPELIGNKLFLGSGPIAFIYSGHQFGYYVPQLGDGRAVLLGQIRDKNDQLFDLQLKGSGPTPYSRGGDGRCVLRSSIREYLASEYMYQLQVPTTRALSIVGSDDIVYREQIETTAGVIRVAMTLVRFGSFEVFHYRKQYQNVKLLADYVINNFLQNETSFVDNQSIYTNQYYEMFKCVVRKTAELIAHWQAIGFIHGVLNTDNMSILGLAIDYGPFSWMDNYETDVIYNHSDDQGRYNFDQQPKIAKWNLEKLEIALSSLFSVADSLEWKNMYDLILENKYYMLMKSKLGLNNETGIQEYEKSLIDNLLDILKREKVDYHNFFRTLGLYHINKNQDLITDRFFKATNYQNEIKQWFKSYQDALEHNGIKTDTEQQQNKIKDKMNKINPKFVARNYLMQIAIEKAQQHKDFSEVERLFQILSYPFDEQPLNEQYAQDPPDWASGLELSCSS